MIKIHKNRYYLDDGGHSLKAPVPPLQPNTVGNLRGYPSRASALVLGSNFLKQNSARVGMG